MSLFIVLLI